MLKQIMIPAAAFAATVTGASAFNGDMLEKIDVDLSASQIETLETMHELRQDGTDRTEMKTLLEDADLDRDKMMEVHKAMREVHDAQREVVQAAIESNDYEAFVAAIADSSLAESLNSEADFEKFVVAHTLKEAGEHEAAAEIMSELGIEKPMGHGHKGGKRGFSGPGFQGGDRQSAETE